MAQTECGRPWCPIGRRKKSSSVVVVFLDNFGTAQQYRKNSKSNNAKCIGTASNAAGLFYPNGVGNGQKVTIECNRPMSGRYVYIQLKKTTDSQSYLTLCEVEVFGTARSTKGGKVHMWSCDENNKNQQWVYDDTTNLIKNKHGICLDASQRSKNGGKIHMWSCNKNNKNQQFVYTPSTGQIKNKHGICLDASQRSKNGGKIHMWSCNENNKNQQWKIAVSPKKITIAKAKPKPKPKKKNSRTKSSKGMET